MLNVNCFPNFFSIIGIYIKHKPARSIKWLSECGSTIEMELEIDGYKFDMNVPLIQAQILILFTEKG